MTDFIEYYQNKKLCIRRNYEGSNHPRWKGGNYVTTEGYLMIYKPNHHFANNRGYIRAHRLVIEENLKCILLPWASVHHIDKNKLNNKISNLMVFSSDSKHKTYEQLQNLEHICLLCKSKETTKQNGKNGTIKFRWYNYQTGVICSKCHDKERYYKNLEKERERSRLYQRKKRRN